MRSLVDNLYERTYQRDASPIRVPKASGGLENISRLVDSQFSEQNSYIKGNFINISQFEGYQRENSQAIKEIKGSIELLNRNVQSTNEIVNKMEVKSTAM